jgi:hypothetical protein
MIVAEPVKSESALPIVAHSSNNASQANSKAKTSLKRSSADAEFEAPGLSPVMRFVVAVVVILLLLLLLFLLLSSSSSSSLLLLLLLLLLCADCSYDCVYSLGDEGSDLILKKQKLLRTEHEITIHQLS